MAQVAKISSDGTGLRIALESSIGVLPGTPIWEPFEPNEYGDFGGEYTLLARDTINDSRQLLKGVITDLDADGQFQNDLVYNNTQNELIWPGIMFAAARTKGEELVTAVDIDAGNPDEYEVADTTGFLVGSLIQGQNFTNAGNNTVNEVTAVVASTSVEVADGTLTAEASPPADARIVVVGHVGAAGDIDVTGTGNRASLTSTVLDFTTLGLIPGEWIFVGGDAVGEKFTNAVNNGWKRIFSVSANSIVIDKSDSPMVDEASTTETIKLFFGRVYRNETGTSIVRSTYQLERTLGAPDDAAPAQIQSEYVVGAMANVININIEQADKVTIDYEFIGTATEVRTGATGVKSGTRPTLASSDALNTSTDFSRINMAVVDATNESPTPLFTYITDLALTINNNIVANKAVGVLGAFDLTEGKFEVTAGITAYFNNVTGISAIENNNDVTLDAILVKSNQAISFDIPLIALGNGRLEIESGEAIFIPLDASAANASTYGTGFDHTLMVQFFDYVPNAADI